MQAGTLLTLEQFFELPDFEQYELVHGELIPLLLQPALHEKKKNEVGWILHCFVNSGEVLVECGFQLDEDSWRRADVAFLLDEGW